MAYIAKTMFCSMFIFQAVFMLLLLPESLKKIEVPSRKRISAIAIVILSSSLLGASFLIIYGEIFYEYALYYLMYVTVLFGLRHIIDWAKLGKIPAIGEDRQGLLLVYMLALWLSLLGGLILLYLHSS